MGAEEEAISFLLEDFALHTLDILFLSNHNIHTSSCGLCFWASDLFIDRFYQKLWIKGPRAQRPFELL